MEVSLTKELQLSDGFFGDTSKYTVNRLEKGKHTVLMIQS